MASGGRLIANPNAPARGPAEKLCYNTLAMAARLAATSPYRRDEIFGRGCNSNR